MIYLVSRRAVNYLSRMHGRPIARWLVWDSSPQFRRDYEIVLAKEVPGQDLAGLMRAYLEMHRLWLDATGQVDPNLLDDDWRHQREACPMKTIASSIKYHALPLVCVGFGRSGFALKFCALMHAARLEEFNSHHLCQWSTEILSGLSV